jgi:hypothetical protein
VSNYRIIVSPDVTRKQWMWGLLNTSSYGLLWVHRKHDITLWCHRYTASCISQHHFIFLLVRCCINSDRQHNRLSVAGSHFSYHTILPAIHPCTHFGLSVFYYVTKISFVYHITCLNSIFLVYWFLSRLIYSFSWALRCVISQDASWKRIFKSRLF